MAPLRLAMTWPPRTSRPILAILLALLALVYSIFRQRALLDAAKSRRIRQYETRLRTERLQLAQQHSIATRPKLALQLQIGRRVEAVQLARLRAMLRALEERRRVSYEASRREAIAFGSASSSQPGLWHSTAGIGDCPAEIPQWDWQLLLSAAAARTDGVARESAIAALASQSRLAPGQLEDLASKYASVLENKEFDGILDQKHPECTGTRFAALEGDRVLRMQCDDPQGATYSVDDDSAVRQYVGPVRVPEGESILAFCGEEFNLISHPRHRPELLERAKGAAGASSGTRKPSVLVFMVDATSRAHFRRSMPKTLAALELIAKHGAGAAAAARDEAAAAARDEAAAAKDGAAGGAPAGGDVEGRIRIFDFERYNVVGYNSMPNQLPLFCGASPDELSSLNGERCVWEMFKKAGGVTMFAEEIHDQCESATTTVNAVWRQAYGVRQDELPDHQWWRLFCSPHIKPCCWAKRGFLNPGRRQCVGGGRTLHEVMIGYLEEFWTSYQAAPRRFAAVNTMVAHEHFMLRLPSLDADLASLLLRMAATVLQDTVVLLLSDHGTHGIWYTEYEVGATEHQLPFLYVLAPEWLMRERPEWLAALTANQRRLVTVHELYRAMRALALYPEPIEREGGLSLFDEMKEGRTCDEAGVPEVYCACRRGGYKSG